MTPLFDRIAWRDPVTAAALDPIVLARTPAGVPMCGALRVRDTSTGRLRTRLSGMELNPRLFPSARSLRPVADLIERSYERFVEHWPEARQVGEIRGLAASLMARAATACAARSPLAMSRWYMEAARYHLPTVARGALPFAAMGGVGLWRRAFGAPAGAREMD